MSTSARVRSRDLRAILTLSHECRDLGDDPRAWWPHLLAGVARLTGAGLAVGGEAAARHGGGVWVTGTADWGWENGFDRSVLVHALGGDAADLTTAPQIAEYHRRFGPGGGPVAARTDLLADADFYPTSYFDDIHRPMGLGHCLLSFLPTPGRPGAVLTLTLSRPLGDRRDFTARQKAIVAEAHAAVAPLVGGPLARFAEPSPADLPPRARQVLRHLLEGDSDKQVAARLRMRPTSVNAHVKRIFAHFGVATRAELLARWVRRGWGTGPGWADDPGR